MTAAPPTSPPPPLPSSGGNGFALAALLTSIPGFCIPLWGVVGIGLGVFHLSRRRSTGNGMAIAGIVIGACGLLLSSVLALGLLLPALAKARSTAREVKSQTQMRQVHIALRMHEEDKGTMPGAGTNLQTTFVAEISPALWMAPADDVHLPGGSYLYLPPAKGADASTTAVLVERPEIDARRLNVLFLDGTARAVPRDEVEALIQAAFPEVYTADGKKWKPAP